MLHPLRSLRRLALLAATLASTQAGAAVITLQMAAGQVPLGSTFSVAIVADIPQAEEIIGFGFDLVSSGNVRYLGFTAGSGFADDPVFLAPFSDADGIRGASEGDLFTGVPVTGSGVLLGTLLLRADALGFASLSLSADDLAGNFTEGLIPLSLALGNFLPPVTPVEFEIATAGNVVPEPPGVVLAALLALGFAMRRRTRSHCD